MKIVVIDGRAENREFAYGAHQTEPAGLRLCAIGTNFAATSAMLKRGRTAQPGKIR